MKSFALIALLGSASALCPNSCSNAGVCSRYDMCTCFANFRGGDCSERTCPFAKAWVTTASGDLNFDGDTVDFTVYNPDSYIQMGASTLRTQFANGGTFEFWPGYAQPKEGHFYMECANRGLCDRSSGECQCFAGYEGSTCQRMVCPNDCSGKGICQSTSYLTKWPSTTTNSWYTTVPASSDYALWDGDMAMSCQCDPGYTGPDCSIRMCPVGDDRLTQSHQIYETQFVDVYTTCESADGTPDTDPFDDCHMMPSATTGLSGSIRLTYTDHFGEKHTTDLIDGVAAHDGATASTIAANAEAKLRALPNGVISPTLTVRATHCQILSEQQHEVGSGLLDPAPTLPGDAAADAEKAFMALGACAAADKMGNNVYRKNKVAVVGTTAVSKLKEDAAIDCAVVDNFAVVAYPQCVRLVVNFNNMPGDIADLKVDTSNVAYGDATTSYTNSQSAGANIASSVTDKLAITTDAAKLTYIAPGLVRVASAAATSKVETTTSGASPPVTSTTITMAEALQTGVTNTFYSKSKIEVFCGHTLVNSVATGTRSLGQYTVGSVAVTGASTVITLEETIPASTIAQDCGHDGSAVAANANILIQLVSHVVVTGTDDTNAVKGSGADNSVDLSSMVTAHTGTALSLELSLSVSESGGSEYVFASAIGSSHETATDSGTATATTSYTIMTTQTTISRGFNKAAASAGTIIGSRTVATAAAITDGSVVTDALTAIYHLDGKGTTESIECGGRGLCDSEAGECKCFLGYSGVSCSEQAALAM